MKEVWYRLAGCVAIAGAFAVAQPELGRAQTPVRDIHNPERRPFQVELQRQVRIPVAAGRESIQVVDVPAGARLVIEHISFHAGSADAVTPGSHQGRYRGSQSRIAHHANGLRGFELEYGKSTHSRLCRRWNPGLCTHRRPG
jgi:hypothetical protein